MELHSLYFLSVPDFQNKSRPSQVCLKSQLSSLNLIGRRPVREKNQANCDISVYSLEHAFSFFISLTDELLMGIFKMIFIGFRPSLPSLDLFTGGETTARFSFQIRVRSLPRRSGAFLCVDFPPYNDTE